MVKIEPERLLGNLRKLSEFGKFSTGVDRTAFTSADMEARHWLCKQIDAIGLRASLDRYANVYGRAPRVGKTILIGSHSDTVPRGGWLDGALGVIYALELATAFTAAGRPVVDVISFQDEEGTFVPCLGSRAFCGDHDVETEVARATSIDGRQLASILPGLRLPEETICFERERHAAFLEAHIEQGPRLEAANIGIGVVGGIVGIRRFRIVAHGQADHAGTTPMIMRQDAGSALIRLAALLLDRMPGWGTADSVWNIGSIEFVPGAPNVVPAQASMVFEFRDVDVETLAFIERKLADSIKEVASVTNISMVTTPIGRMPPAKMDNRLQKIFVQAARDIASPMMNMPSGAGHDAMVTAQVLPTIMLFIPSIGGRSHNISENTSDTDIVRGCEVMARAIDRMIGDGWVGTL